MLYGRHLPKTLTRTCKLVLKVVNSVFIKGTLRVQFCNLFYLGLPIRFYSAWWKAWGEFESCHHTHCKNRQCSMVTHTLLLHHWRGPMSQCYNCILFFISVNIKMYSYYNDWIFNNILTDGSKHWHHENTIFKQVLNALLLWIKKFNNQIYGIVINSYINW